MKTAMDTTLLENTELLFLMVAPRLLPTVLTMMLDTLLMSSMKVSPLPMLPQLRGLFMDQPTKLEKISLVQNIYYQYLIATNKFCSETYKFLSIHAMCSHQNR
jgi:hypothetical protein